jgi:uncharacterized protein YjbJ (UPF0337 family)
MNEDTVKGMWHQFRGQMKQLWGRITDDEFDELDGNREKLSGRIQEKYGRTKDEVDKELDQFFDKHSR